jgi:cell division protein FtsA
MRKNNQHIMAIDLGSYSTKVFLVEKDLTTKKIKSIDSVIFKSQGISRGKITNINLFNHLINDIVNYLKQKKVMASQINLGLNGDCIEGLKNVGVVRFNKSNHIIDQNDIKRVKSEIQKHKIKPTYQILQIVSNSYNLDGQKNIIDPVGLMALHLELESYVVLISTSVIEQIKTIFSQHSLNLNYLCLSSFAASQLVLNNSQKEFGSVVLDIGFQTSNLLVFQDNKVILIKVIPIGSQHITSDLAVGLRIDLEIAEQLKISFDNLGKNLKKVIFINNNHQSYKFNLEDISRIIEARLDDLISIVKDNLSIIDKENCLPGGLILTGNGSKIIGLEAYLEEALNLSCKKAEYYYSDLNTNINDPGLIAVAGLAELDKFYANNLDLLTTSLNKNKYLKVFTKLFH